MKITAKYLIIPINMQMRGKKVILSDKDGNPIFDFDANLDPHTPQFYSYLYMERFRGMEFNVTIQPEEIDYEFQQTETKPTDGFRDDYLRPSVHFSADIGWLNDPNGLVYHDGVYHLFYQINPIQPTFGSMHWGHATSTDLMHWVDGDIALHPDDMGTMFSGSGIVDKENVTGLSPDGNTILLYYTTAAEHTVASRGKLFCQCLAYSKDGGKTVTKYEKNPVVRNYGWGNRDPKVVWCEELDCYFMAIYQADNSLYYRVLESKNLLDWTPIQDVCISETTSECPDIYPIEVNGERKWIFSGANDTYLVGHFDKETRKFVTDSGPKKLQYGNASYAGQTFTGTGDRIVKFVCNVFRDTGTKFSSQMGIPTEMSLVKLFGDYYLKGVPVAEFDALPGKTETYHGSTKVALSHRSAYDITVKVPRNTKRFEVSLFGKTLTVAPIEESMYFDNFKVPLSITCDDVELRIITDTFTMECFLDGGLVHATFGGILDKSLNKLNVTSEKAEITVKELDKIFN